MARKAFQLGASLLTLGAGLLANFTAMAAQPDLFDGQWHYSLTPYLWLPTLDGTAFFPLRPPLAGRTVDVEVKPNQYLSALKFGALLAGEARKGEWSVATDILYMRLGASGTRIRSISGPRGAIVIPTSSYANGSVDLALWGVVGGYTLLRGTYGNLDVIAGIRYAYLKAQVDLAVTVGPLGASDSPSASRNATDGIGGVKGALNFAGDRTWYLPYEFDIGGKSGNTTYNGEAGVGYRFGWGDVIAGYRALKYKFSDRNLQDIRFNGPVIAASFHW
jgi:hypothetical protein